MDLFKKFGFLVLIALFSFCSKKDNDPKDEVNTIIDIDGNIYTIVQVGTQEWMVENLRTTHYKNGDEIPFISGEPWDNQVNGAYCVYNNNINNKETYGLLYNWMAVEDPRGLCPDGWHIPSIAEWEDLASYGLEIKEEGTDHWLTPNNSLSGFSGFNALPGGNCGYDGSYTTLGGNGYYWTKTEDDSELAWMTFFTYMNTGVSGWINMNKWIGASVRCLKD